MQEITGKELLDIWESKELNENSVVSVFITLIDDSHKALDIRFNKDTGYYVVTFLFSYWFTEFKKASQCLHEMNFGEGVKHHFDDQTYVHYIDWYDYALERISAPCSRFTVSEDTEVSKHIAKVSFFPASREGSARFYVRETFKEFFNNPVDAVAKAKSYVESCDSKCKTLKVEVI